ncbi:MAG TPA: hypothetical protein VN306_16860 [Mycobacterium sp.]|nr:hypothetical protein [Mycobacterium sp.]
MHPENHRWVTGDQFGLAFPTDPVGLRSAGPRFLTDAFRVAGVLDDDNSVTSITGFREVAAGSTGRKVALSVEYDEAASGLHADLFVKFSRDPDNPIRDRGKTQMEPEVRFAALSRAPGFPIAVPHVQFGDYHRRSGTGILITERIRFGDNGIERQYHKCLDYRMPEPFAHYRALLTALARLAGTHRSGRLPAGLTAHFPLDVRAATVGDRAPVSAEKLERRLNQLVEFVETHPGLVPTNVGSPEFLARLREGVPRIAHHEHTVARQLAADSDYVALCHWNANIDNAWFWRDADHVLHCGLMDWGCVGQMNMGMAIWGAMSGAETDMWNRHLDELLHLFVAEVHRYGGPNLDPDRLRRHTLLYAAVMGVAWLLDVPALIHRRFGVAAPGSRGDPRIKDDESVRAPLQMLSNLLSLWERYRVGDLLDEALAEEERVA